MNCYRETIGVDKDWGFRKRTVKQLCDYDYRHGCRINNLHKAAETLGLTAYSKEEIAQRAQAFYRRPLSYNILSYNCEYFVTHCRYGVAFSMRAKQSKNRRCYTALFHEDDRDLVPVIRESKCNIL